MKLLSLVILSTILHACTAGCPFMKKDGSADADVFSNLLGDTHHHIRRRLDEEVSLEAQKGPGPGPQGGGGGGSPPPPPPPPPSSPPPSAAATLHPTAGKPTATPTTSTVATLHPTAATPTVAPSVVKTVSPSFKPTTTPSSTAPTASPVSPNVGYVAPFCLKTNGKTITSSKAGTCSAYNYLSTTALPSAVASFTNTIDLAHFYGASLRLAFHDAGEVDITKTDLLGPDGCLQTINGDNAGLIEVASPVFATIEPMWQQVCDQISRADFWALLGKAVVEKSAGAAISINYQYGRKDQAVCTAGAGRLPSAQGGSSTISQVFVTQMGLTMDDVVTLIGAHTLGHVHTENSGYGITTPSPATNILINAWDTTPTVFDNQYYKSLLNVAWDWKQPDGPTKSIFTTPANQVMLGTDMVLGYPANTAAVVAGSVVGTPGQHCGPNPYGCNAPGTTPATTAPSTFALATSYAANNALFLANFATAYTKMTTVGYGVPAKADGSTATGKLGTLTSVDFTTC